MLPPFERCLRPNTDQGSQFTSAAFTGVLEREEIAISMDGRGCWRDNVFVERLWRSAKYEEVCLHAYGSVLGFSPARRTRVQVVRDVGINPLARNGVRHNPV